MTSPFTRWRITRRAAIAVAALCPPAALALASCGGGSDGPSGPATGALAITVAGLPAAAPAAVVVTGPSGYTAQVTATGTLSSLAPGSYRVAASEVDAGETLYAPTSRLQTVSVAAGSTPASAAVSYAVNSGTLTVTVSGLPQGAAANVSVSGPSGFAPRTLAGASSTLTRLRPGSYTITVAPITVGGDVYDAPDEAARTQRVALVAGASETRTATYAKRDDTRPNLTIDGLYLTQSVQRLDGTVPLVQGRPALLRVFARSTRALGAAPLVRVTLAAGGRTTTADVAAQSAAQITAGAAASEASLAATWNVEVPAGLVQPGLTVSARVDPDGQVAEPIESDNVFPAAGGALPVDVRPAPPLRLRLVPIYQGASGLSGSVDDPETLLTSTRRIHPLNAIDTDVGPPLTTTAVPTQDDADRSWEQLLSELRVRRIADATDRYYYGVLRVTYASGVAGLGYVGFPVAIGWDYQPSGSEVLAHELGHTWGRRHAPCEVATTVDASYPYAGGKTGVYGYDVTTRTLKPPTANDIMGYCSGKWISDYTYQGVLSFRAAEAGAAGAAGDAGAAGSAGAGSAAGSGDAADAAPAGGAPVQPCLVVWGRVVRGEPVLEPAFEATTRPALPRGAGGPLALTATAASGATLWSLSFAGDEIADSPTGDRTFAFAIPLGRARAGEIAALRFAAGGRSTASAAAGAAPPNAPAPAEPDVRVARTGRARWVRVRWNAARHPMLVVRDPRSGAILAFARGGDARVRTARDGDDAVDVVASDRVRSAARRVPVRAQ
ncbi:MAG: hypothetical protein ACJ79S_20375 [Gemmatimonadaceae bacterium]